MAIFRIRMIKPREEKYFTTVEAVRTSQAVKQYHANYNEKESGYLFIDRFSKRTQYYIYFAQFEVEDRAICISRKVLKHRIKELTYSFSLQKIAHKLMWEFPVDDLLGNFCWVTQEAA